MVRGDFILRILIAPDSFKGSLSAIDVCTILKPIFLDSFRDSIVDAIPLADGGEGTVEALVDATGGRQESVRVTGPLGDLVQARYGILGDGETAAAVGATT